MRSGVVGISQFLTRSPARWRRVRTVVALMMLLAMALGPALANAVTVPTPVTTPSTTPLPPVPVPGFPPLPGSGGGGGGGSGGGGSGGGGSGGSGSGGSGSGGSGSGGSGGGGSPSSSGAGGSNPVGLGAVPAAQMFPLPPLGTGPVLYVDQNSIGGACSDSRKPVQVTISTPWCTLTQAAASAPSGSIVLVRAGNYPFTAMHSIGSRSDYVSFMPFGFGTSLPETVTISGISTQNTSFLRFMGFHLVGSDTSQYVAGIQIYIGSQYIQFIDNDVTGEGVQLQTASHVLLQGNYLHNITRNCSLTAPDGGGMFLTGGSAPNPPADDLQVLGNTIQDTPQDAINLVHNLTNVVVDGNNVSTTLTPQCGDHTDLVQIEGDAKGPYTLTNNVFHDGVQFILRNATGLTIENNLMIRVQQWMQLVADPGARVINNTWWDGNNCPDGIHNCTAGSLLIRDYAPGSSWTQPPFNYTNHMTGTIIENNIMRIMENDTANPVPTSDYHEDYDLIYGPKQNNSGVEGRRTGFRPAYFVDAADGNFAPAGDSSAIDSGNPTVAPSYDLYGHRRRADPRVRHVGSGASSYVDRGAVELQPPTS
jgi:hypothetical protein